MPVRYETADGIARITFDAPGRRNALTPEDRYKLADELTRLRHDPEVRVVLMTGAGSDFCTGADVGQMGKDDPAAARVRMQRGVGGVARALAAMEKPVVSAVRGYAVGFGWSMPLASDMVIASETARFSMLFSKRGLAPDGGSLHFLIRHIGQMRAKEMALTARMIEAREALDLGLVTRVVADDALEAETEALCADLLARPTRALGLTRMLFETATTASLDSYLEVEAFVQSALNQSEDYREAIAAFREKRPPVFRGR